MTEQLAEKHLLRVEICKKLTSGAEARFDSVASMPGMNPRPTSKASFFRKL
jgi:hypothetical protein